MEADGCLDREPADMDLELSGVAAMKWLLRSMVQFALGLLDAAIDRVHFLFGEFQSRL